MASVTQENPPLPAQTTLVARVRRFFARRYVRWIAAFLFAIAGGALFADWFVAFPTGATASYVGRGKCIQCHETEVHRWEGSHHDKAMDLATPKTVLGNFDDQEFTYHGAVSRFTREGDKFFIATDGPGGKPGKFQVNYTFGVEPLQQYMVEMERGRVQVLPFAWDTQGKRWFHLYQDDPRPVTHDDPLHWTQPAQNWNHVCADCHSTNLQKGYDNATDTFHTTFSEINVSCEACHGPGSMHVELAEKKWLFWDRNHGYGLANVRGANSAQLDACARCHSHRSSIHPGFHAGGQFLDHYLPALLDSGLYHADGQIDEEAYEYGSFQQSLMYRKDVRCSNCHDPHTAKIKFQGNKLCTQCHTPAKYDTPAHHHHQADGAGGQCAECHMPTKKYMVVHARRDHSLRVPRPDLSVQLGTPNACTGCHLEAKKAGQADEYPRLIAAARQNDENARDRLRTLDDWAAKQIVQWYGEKRRDDPHYGLTLAAAMHRQLPEGAENPMGQAENKARTTKRPPDDEIATQLIALAAKKRDVGPIVRASAVSLMAEYATADTRIAIDAALKDREPLVRLAAARGLLDLHGITTATRWEFDRLQPREADVFATSTFLPLHELAVPRLADPIRAVRFEAARALAVMPTKMLSRRELNLFETVLAEYRAGCLDSGDQAASHVMLAELAGSQSKFDEAEREYRTALDRLPDCIPARTGLAELCRHLGRREEAEKQLHEAIRIVGKLGDDDRHRRPQEAELYYHLGRVVVSDRARLNDAAGFFAQAMRLVPDHVRARFALAVVRQEQGDWDGAEAEYLSLGGRFPRSSEYREALASIYQLRVDKLSRQQRWADAAVYAKKLANLLPGDEQASTQLREIQRKAH